MIFEVLASRTTSAAPVRRISACVLAATAWVSFGNAAFAQRTGASLDAGALNMRYADSVDANAIALTPSLWAESNLTSLSVTGTLSSFTAGGWSAQGSADGSFFTKQVGLLLGEFEGTAGGSTHNDGSRTGQLLGVLRAHLSGVNQGIWIGAGAGGAWDGSIWRSVRQGEVAAWGHIGSATAFASATPVIVDDSIKYTDAQLSASFNLPVVELSASGGFRNGSNLPTLGGNAKSWGNVSITGWLASRLAIVASAGTYPVDFTQGFPGGRFASLSVRLGSRRFPPATPSVHEIDDLSSISSPASRGGISFQSRNVGGTIRELRLRAPVAQKVEVMGDFTGWKPVQLQNAGGGWWSASFPIPRGMHELNLRVDGGAWIAPPGIPSKKDEFGGSVGMLIIQ